VVRTPFNAPNIADTIHALDRDPARVARIRTGGVIGVLNRHDWSHRLQDLLKVAGYAATPAMRARTAELDATAKAFQSIQA